MLHAINCKERRIKIDLFTVVVYLGEKWLIKGDVP